MCLGIPGKVIELSTDQELVMGKVDFGGVAREVCLAYVPEVKVGEYVIVHVGFAISVVDEKEALTTFEYLRQMGELAEIEEPS
jgi:hydrogenase expression/formation protein HypC